MAEIEIKQYVQTKEKCESLINGICDSCGGELEPIETVDNAGSPTFWSGCMKCRKFTGGTDPFTYKMAVELVDKWSWVPYSYKEMSRLRSGSDFEKAYWRECQIAGVVSQVRQMLQVKKELEGKGA